MGYIYNIQRFSLHDGPGIRTTIFMKGCPLRCKWCHNPESQRLLPQLSLFPQRCIGCGKCMQQCSCHRLQDGVHTVDFSACTACGRCVSVCPSTAIEMMGRDASAEEIIAEAARDMAFYRSSGGGITLSGGEPTMQPDFAVELLRLACERGIHTAMETCGYADPSVFERLLPYLRLVLFDIKQMDADKHELLTGVRPERIWENLRRLCREGEEVRTIVRVPIIPRHNDEEENMVALSAMLRSLPQPPQVELLPYNPLAGSKYPRLGMRYEPGEIRESEGASPEHLCDILTQSGVCAHVLR